MSWLKSRSDSVFALSEMSPSLVCSHAHPISSLSLSPLGSADTVCPEPRYSSLFPALPRWPGPPCLSCGSLQRPPNSSPCSWLCSATDHPPPSSRRVVFANWKSDHVLLQLKTSPWPLLPLRIRSKVFPTAHKALVIQLQPHLWPHIPPSLPALLCPRLTGCLDIQNTPHSFMMEQSDLPPLFA